MSIQIRHTITAALLVAITIAALLLVRMYDDHFGFIFAAALLGGVVVLRFLEDSEQALVRASSSVMLLAAIWFALMGTLAMIAR